ncbi:MAG: hypothetical protein AB1611_04890 [bacterium]
MLIERKYSLELPFVHKDKGQAVSKADSLVCIFFKKINSHEFFLLAGTEDDQQKIMVMISGEIFRALVMEDSIISK